jgi:hypothetical protein
MFVVICWCAYQPGNKAVLVPCCPLLPLLIWEGEPASSAALEHLTWLVVADILPCSHCQPGEVAHQL